MRARKERVKDGLEGGVIGAAVTRNKWRRSELPAKRGGRADSRQEIYRHGMDVDKSGDRLAMGSTTGSLWLSEDQGDSFRTLSTQLPPIYSVRFA